MERIESKYCDKMGVNLRSVILFTLFVCLEHVSACNYGVNRDEQFGKQPNCGEQQCFCDGQSARCIGDKMWTVLPKIPRQVSELYAECYDLSNFVADSLANVRHLDLTTLRLRQNDIQNISKDIFRDFQRLKIVEISDNDYLGNKLLLSSLNSLNKSQVLSLSLQGNQLSTLNITAFEEFINLRDLRLNDNRIKSLKGTGELKTLQELHLTGNYLRAKNALQFCHQSFSRFPNLKKLFLGQNRLGRNGRPLQIIWRCLDNLEYLDLSNNTIGLVNITLFIELKSLKYLNLASNWIERVDVGHYPPCLESINFYDNHFKGLLPNLCFHIRGNKTFPQLKHLYFGRNYLQKLGTRWNCLPRIETLDFNRNDVRVISNHTFSNFKQLKTLVLSNMIPWNKYFELEAFKSESLQKLDIRYNWIDFSKQQNKKILAFSPNVKWLDISYNIFTGMTTEAVKDIVAPIRNLETLIMQHIKLKTFPVEVLENLTQLKALNIDDNHLHSIEFSKSFTKKSKELKIQNISVAYSLINTITEKAFPLRITKGLKYIDLSENQFVCDCDMEWFRDQINSTGYIGNVKLLDWPGKYLCRSPSSLNGHLFENYQPITNCKPLDPVIIALIAIGSFLVVFIAVASVLYWNRWYVKYWWYKINRRRRDFRDPEQQPILEKTFYDGYVVSNQDDNAFVHHPLRELLEDRLGFKLHIWERDAKNGVLVDVMLDGIYASKNTIVVVSNNLIKDSWCKFQIDVALDRSIELRRKCVVLVVLEDVDFNPISSSWCVLLTKMPTAYWSNEADSIKRKLFEESIRSHLGLQSDT